jgi:hypothetical protein
MKQFAPAVRDQIQTKLQYDYFDAYLAMHRADAEKARGIASKYVDHGVPHWRAAFTDISQQLEELSGSPVRVVDTESRNQTQTKLAASDTSFEFDVESRQVTVRYQNLEQVDANYYLMDIELLYSRNPFVQQYTSEFSHIRPNLSETIELPRGEALYVFSLPEELHNRNVLIELRGGGEARTQVYYSNALAVQRIENYGQLRVAHADSSQPLAAVYVKVYARMKDGTVRFYKDGYTDLRGRFDYSSLSTNELEYVDRFAVLVLSDDHGAVVREASPPVR